MYSTEYFGEALIRTDLSSLKSFRTPVLGSDLISDEFLTRGVAARSEDSVWVGRTVRRGQSSGVEACIEVFSMDGSYLGERIAVPSVKGPYAICVN